MFLVKSVPGQIEGAGWEHCEVPVVTSFVVSTAGPVEVPTRCTLEATVRCMSTKHQ